MDYIHASVNYSFLKYTEYLTILKATLYQKQLKGFPGGSVVKNPAANAGDMGVIPGSERSPREGNGNPLRYSYLRNPMDRGAWQATPMGLQKSQQLNNNSNLCT